MTEAIRNRIVGHGEEAPDQLLANPRNWRIHPKAQQTALGAVLDEVGWIQSIIVNQRTGFVVDGHLRVALAITRGEASVPVVYVDLDENEEAIALATIDPLSAMAGTDRDLLGQLLGDVVTTSADLQAMLDATGGAVGEVGFPELPEGERGPFRTMTFTVSADQEETIGEALRRAKDAGPFAEGNENSNGNALARLAEAYP